MTLAMRTESDPRLQLVPAAPQVRAAMFALCVLLPLIVAGFAMLNASLAGDASQPLPHNLPLALMATLGGTLVLLLAVWFVLDRAMCRHRLHVSDAALQIKTSFYSESVAWSELSLETARIVDLHERTDFKPSRKSNAYALPGFKSGRFRLKNGDKAFVAIAGERRALWLPTRRGFGLLLQPQQPDALLKYLRELAAGAARR